MITKIGADGSIALTADQCESLGLKPGDDLIWTPNGHPGSWSVGKAGLVERPDGLLIHVGHTPDVENEIERLLGRGYRVDAPAVES